MNPIDRIHALLFVAELPVTLNSLAQALQMTEGQVEQGLEVLKDRLDENGPIQLLKLAGGYQLSTKAEFALLVGNFLKPQRQRLSRSLMEVLAIVAYRQPITMAEIDVIRGVQSDYSVKALHERRLVEEVGRRKAPGRPVLYGTSQQFLHQFKMHDISDLPVLDAVTSGSPHLSLPQCQPHFDEAEA